MRATAATTASDAARSGATWMTGKPSASAALDSASRDIWPSAAILLPWFLAIVSNRCRTVRRGRWWSVVRLADVPSQRERHVSVEEGYDLRQAIAALPEGQRAVLFLYFYLDLSQEQIAVVL